MNKYAIQVFPGEQTYGIYKNSYWYGLYSINNPIYKWVIQRIKNETPNQDIFDIFAFELPNSIVQVPRRSIDLYICSTVFPSGNTHIYKYLYCLIIISKLLFYLEASNI